MTEQQRLRQELIEWAAGRADRDNLIRASLAAGIKKQEIYELTGIARTTINRAEKKGAS